MRPYTKMMMLTGAKKSGGGEYRGRMEYRGNAEFRGEYGGEPEGRFRDGRGRERYDDGRFAPKGEWRQGDEMEPEARFRDRRGREHYDNGRYAPRSAYEPEDRIPPVFDGGTGYRMDGGTRMIGFSGGEEIRSRYPMDAAYRGSSEFEHHGGQKIAGHASSSVEGLDRKTAHEWVKRMRHADGGSGEHWSYDQTSAMMRQRNVECDPVEFYAIMNVMWSDYGKVADKFGVNTIDFWAELTKAFLHDKDANPDKAALYYECIVKK